MAQLREEHLRPRGVRPMDRGYYPDRAEPAPRGPFGGYFPEPSGESETGPSNPFLHPQRDGLMVSLMRRRDTMESQTIGYQLMMACHRGEPHCRFQALSGIDLRFFDDEGKFEPGAIEHFP